MVVAQADGDHAVDGRPAHRPGQRAVQRRDEVERVAGLLGRRRDAFGERPEERVREDDRQRLRGQHPDRQRLALGQHPRHRVRAVAQLIGHHADPVGRLRRQSIGAVERERDGRLRHAGLAGDVGDARSDRALFHGSPVGGICGRPSLAGPPRPDQVVATRMRGIGRRHETKTGLANRFRDHSERRGPVSIHERRLRADRRASRPPHPSATMHAPCSTESARCPAASACSSSMPC